MNKRRRTARAAFSSPVESNRSGRGVELLEARLLFAAAPVGSRVSNALGDLYDRATAGQDLAQFARDYNLQVDAQERVSVTLRATRLGAMSKALGALGFVETASFPDLHFVEGLLPVRAVKAAEAISGLGRYGIEVNYLPLVGTGSVNSQADFVLEADRERLTTPGSFNGAGQRIGVLSDSYNNLGGAAADIASGDLPAAGVTVLQDVGSGGTDEGRAMLQLIHDIAPGSPLAFATAFVGGEGGFANNITALANPAQGNCTVVVDDVTYFAEPMFQDGVISQAINNAVTTRNINYFSSAGNQADRSYESTTFAVGADTVGAISGSFYDFDPGAGVDTRQQITVANGARVTITMQWDDPFYTASGVDTDLDLFLVDNSNVIRAQSTVSNVATQAPGEVAQFLNNTGAALTLNVAIRKVAGPNPGRIKYVNFGGTINQFATNSSTLSPHAGAANANGVGAAAYFQQEVPESFTSKGGATILFSPTGTPIAPQTRNSPQITAADGTNTTFFGSDIVIESDGRPNFFGTSAAAPHAAAVAALVRQANPAFTPAQVYSRLQTTADDITVSGVGFDALTGFGMINAFDAVYPTVPVASLNFADGFESGVLPSHYETRSTNSGRIEVATSDGPFAGTRHVTMDTSVPFAVGGVNQLGLNELTLHVNASGAGTKTLSFRQKEFGDEDHAMPATFTNTINADGVALSVDGTNWFRIVSLTGGASSASYTLNTFNLTSIATTAGITLGADTRIRFQQYDDFRTSDVSPDGFAFDEISVTSAAAVSATPGTPDLAAATDTGTSSTDNNTNRDNSTGAKNLQFSVTGTVSGATVSIYSSGTLIGTAVAGGTTTTVTTNGTVDLADGGRSITARQTESGKSESPDSGALPVTIDTAGPTVDVVDVGPDPRTVGVSSVAVNFNEAVAGFDLADLSLTRDAGSNLLTGTHAPTGGSTNFTVPNLLAPTSVSGTYVLTVVASGSGITDVAGNALAANASDTWVHGLPTWLSASGTAASWNSQTKALTVTGAATITADPAADAPAVSASGASAALTINPSGGSVVNLATLSLAGGAVATMTNHGANPVRALVLNSNPTIAAGTKLDLTNNVLVVRNGILAGIQAQVAATYANGAWTGTGGIASSTAAASTTTAVGFASNAGLNLTTFAGVTGLTSAAVFVKYTYYGDSDLDGDVDGNDVGAWAANFTGSGGSTTKSWDQGDWDLDGDVDGDDVGRWAANFTGSGGGSL